MTTIDNGHELPADAGPVCDCGYRSRGASLAARVRDAQQHALDVHGIDVSAHQVLDESGGTTS